MRSYDEITPEWCEQNKIVYWDSLRKDRLEYESVDEAIECALYGIEPLPATVKLMAFRRMTPNCLNRNEVVNAVLESFDEELGDPEGECSEVTPAMLYAADVFLAVMERKYVPWSCEDVETFEVDVQRWIAVHRSQWEVKLDSPFQDCGGG